MIYELRTYTLVPGTQGQYLEHNRETGRAVRGDRYGTLVGSWTTEIGPLNQFVHLWSYPSFEERTRLRGELAKNRDWTEGYLPKIRPLLVAQENKLLSEVLPLQPPAAGAAAPRRGACSPARRAAGGSSAGSPRSSPGSSPARRAAACAPRSSDSSRGARTG